MPNARFTQPTFTNGQVVENWNLTQLVPHTPIGVGVTGLTFRECSLVNCDVPADATVEKCLRGQVSFCSNLNPDWKAFGLAVCPENCTHVVDTDAIVVDGVLVQTIYHYEHKTVT